MAENTPWIWHSATQLPMTTDPFDPDPESEPKKLQIIIPVISIVIIIILAIGIFCWYRKRKRKAQNQTFEAPETKIRLSLLGTQYQISNEISRKSSSEESTEFREKALVDSELEQTDNESPMQYMVLPPENQSKHGSTYLYLHDNQQSRRSTRSSQDFSMSDIVGSLKLKAPLASEDSQDSLTRPKSTSEGTHVPQGDIQRTTSESVLDDTNTPILPLKKKRMPSTYKSTGVLNHSGISTTTKRKIASRRKPAKYFTQSDTDLHKRLSDSSNDSDFVDVSELPPLPSKSGIQPPLLFPKQKINKSPSDLHRIDKALIEKFKVHKPTLEDLDDYEDLPESKMVPEEILGEDYDEPIPHSRLVLK